MSTVLVSALVAAFVTLGIEFFAKPSLEARKDRILERHRRRRAVIGHVKALSFQLGGLQYAHEGGATALDDDESRDLVRTHSSALIDSIAAGGDEVDDLEAEGISGVAAVWSVHLESPKPTDGPQGADVLAYTIGDLLALTDALEDLLCTPRWRWQVRRRAAQRMDRLMEPSRPRHRPNADQYPRTI